MKRKLLFLERWMYGDGISPFNGVFGMKIRGDISQENLRHALDKIQAKHPVLRAGIIKDKNGMPWYVENENPPEIDLRIVTRHGDEDWIGETKAEWTHAFDTQTGPLIRAVWLQSATVSDLLLTIHHCMCDGSSILTLVRDILTLLDEPGVNIGITPPPFTSLQDLIPTTIYSSGKNKTKRVLLKGIVGVLTILSPVISRIRKKKKINTANREDYLINWRLDKETSSSLLRHCTKLGITTHAALSAAFLLAFRQVKGAKARNKIICPVDIRRYVKEIKKDTIFSFGLAAYLSLDNKPGTDFWTTAKNIQKSLANQTHKLNGYEFLMTLECFHPTLKSYQEDTMKDDVNYDLMFSNLGRLDIPKSFRAFEVEAVYPPTVMGPSGNYNTVLTATFRGQMDFSFVGSTHHFSYEDAITVKNIAMELLLKENSTILQEQPI